MHAHLPIHPTTGLTALGIMPSGRIVWPVLGGSREGEGGIQEGQGSGDHGQGAPDRTFGQGDVDRIVADRLARERGKYADYDDLQEKAKKYDEYQASQQTDLEKLQGTHEDTLGKLSRVEHELRITRAAAKHGLSQEAAAFLHGETDDEVDEAAKKLAALTNPTGSGGGTNDNGTGNGGGNNAGGRQPDPSQGRGSTGEGATSLAAGADRYRRSKTPTTP